MIILRCNRQAESLSMQMRVRLLNEVYVRVHHTDVHACDCSTSIGRISSAMYTAVHMHRHVAVGMPYEKCTPQQL